jgi:bifunctional non-homologous end joining protein LigD
MARRPAQRSPKTAGRTAAGRTKRSSRAGASSAAANLREYRRKRHFESTPEPTGGVPSEGLPRFTIQKHDATRLHYDLRLEVDGTLKSWAVPKGPSLDPADKRLAVRTEDHPLKYLTFEGVIPEGNYGAGAMIVWDTGTYVNLKRDRAGKPIPVGKALEMGGVEIWFQGQKIKGGYALIRTRGGAPGKENWLLIKMRDKAAEPSRDVLNDEPASAVSGRTVEELLKKEGTASQVRKRQAKTAKKPRTEMPKWIDPMLATLADGPPEGKDWIYEAKLDGFRALAFREGGNVRLLSRNKKDLETRFPEIVEALKQQPVDEFIIDGEVVALDGKGRPSFSLLQTRLKPTTLEATRKGRSPLVFYAFDLLYARGFDTRDLPQAQRSALLREAVAERGPIRITEQLSGDGAKLLAKVCSKGWEGLIAKRPDAPYLPGKRSTHWLKLKCVLEQEFVIGGYTDPEGARTAFGALLVGYYKNDKLIYAGKVGTGYTEKVLADVLRQLKPLKRAASLFAPDPEIQRRGVHFVEPKLVAQVGFSEWTHDGHIRHPRFLGLRIDKEARDVVLEKPVHGPKRR